MNESYNCKMNFLSEKQVRQSTRQNYRVALFLGSFAPFHDGHRDVIVSSISKLEDLDIDIKYFIICLHNDRSVAKKISSKNYPIRKRIGIIEKNLNTTKTIKPNLVINDISCHRKLVFDMTKRSVKDICKILKIKPSQIIIVLGSDNALTIYRYIKNHKVCCVIRPGYGFEHSVNNNLIISQRTIKRDISSSIIRNNYAQ